MLADDAQCDCTYHKVPVGPSKRKRRRAVFYQHEEEGGEEEEGLFVIKNELHIYFLFSTFKLFMQPFCSK